MTPDSRWATLIAVDAEIAMGGGACLLRWLQVDDDRLVLRWEGDASETAVALLRCEVEVSAPERGGLRWIASESGGMVLSREVAQSFALDRALDVAAVEVTVRAQGQALARIPIVLR